MTQAGRLLASAIATLALGPAAGPAAGQQAPPAALVADALGFDGQSQTVTASGNVQIFYDRNVLQASRLVYDGDDDTLVVEGPLTLTDPSGATIIFADFARLSRDLQDGVLQSARLVLDRQLQIAADSIERTDGRFTTLQQTVASACNVCADNPVPLWEIRARRITHDAEARQLYFEGAQLRALGVPVAYLPRMRLPDPTVARQTGFLAPEIRANDQIGTGIRIPYFITLGDQADLTVTPFVTNNPTQTLELAYRQAFARGFVDARGALTWDDLDVGTPRGFVFADGVFDLGRDTVLSFDLEYSSDNAYLVTYGFSDLDRLDSEVAITRVTRSTFLRAGGTHYITLRDGEDETILPTEVLFGEVVHRWRPGALGGIATVEASAEALRRTSDLDGDGRDVASVALGLGWRRDWIGPAGILAAVEARLDADAYRVAQDSAFPGTRTRVVPTIATQLRWPLAARDAAGVSHLIEPTVQLAYSPPTDATVPNEDSAVVEFDEGNLFALSRFAGDDAIETGLRAALGATYTRTDPAGWSLGLTAGQVFRAEATGVFPAGSELAGAQSDWLLGAHVTLGERLTLMNRAILEPGGDLHSNELSLAFAAPRYTLGTTATWLAADAAEGRPDDTAEVALAAAYDLPSAWAAAVDLRVDFDTGTATRTGLALTYETECVDVTFSVERRNTESASVEPSTDVGLSVAFTGFGAREGRAQDRVCRR